MKWNRRRHSLSHDWEFEDLEIIDELRVRFCWQCLRCGARWWGLNPSHRQNCVVRTEIVPAIRAGHEMLPAPLEKGLDKPIHPCYNSNRRGERCAFLLSKRKTTARRLFSSPFPAVV